MTYLPVWRLEEHRAALELRRWRLSLDVSRPEEGIVAAESDRRGAAAPRILGVTLVDPSVGRASIADCYVRGVDLVATYALPMAATRVQVYWRAASVADHDASIAAAIVDVQVSVQSDVLDAHPRLSTRSVLAATRVERLVQSQDGSALEPLTVGEAAPRRLAADADGACLIAELAGDERHLDKAAYVEMVHPADLRQSRLSRRGQDLVIEHDLFTERTLEKGVLLRARVRGTLLRSAPSIESITAEYLKFIAAPLPLTT